MLFIMLHSLISYILVAIAWCIFGVPIILLLIVPERWRYDSKAYFWFVYQFLYWSLKATFLPIKFVGLQNIPSNVPVIFAANHQSALDIPLVGVLAQHHPHVWLAWSKLADYPLFGLVLKRLAILVDTTTPMRATRTLLRAINRIKDNHHHVIIFPEGARYTDGKVHDFFSGFVILTRRTGRPVVPVFIRGSSKAYPPHAWLLHLQPITVIVGSPLEIREEESDESFKQRVHNWFVIEQEK
jgi:1-acyl-sn-glycerol-3-phosphate acyltransferase